MIDEQRCMAVFQAQPCGTGHFSALLRYGSFVCNKHMALAMPCRNKKMAASLRPHFMLAGPR
jgi:hypothetical protein